MESDAQYPVTHLQAAKWLRSGNSIKRRIRGESLVEIRVGWVAVPKKIRCRMWSAAGTWWTDLSWKQLLGFIRRNYSRKYAGL